MRDRRSRDRRARCRRRPATTNKFNHGGRDEFGGSANGTAGRHDQHAREIMTARLRFARTDAARTDPARATRSHRFRAQRFKRPTLQAVPLERPRGLAASQATVRSGLRGRLGGSPTTIRPREASADSAVGRYRVRRGRSRRRDDFPRSLARPTPRKSWTPTDQVGGLLVWADTALGVVDPDAGMLPPVARSTNTPEVVDTHRSGRSTTSPTAGKSQAKIR